MNGLASEMDGVREQHAVQERLGPRKLINRAELIRLIEQALHRLGYVDVAHLLEQQAGIPMQPPHATQFQEAVLEGRWEAALDLLPQLTTPEDVLKETRFLILQQKYLEALERQDLGAALTCLRLEMAPLGVHEQQLHHLAALLLCPASGDTASRSSWLGGGVAHRDRLLALLQSKLPPQLLIPEGRLEVLLEQALEAQMARCPFSNAASSRLTLFADFNVGVEALPTETVQVLDRHSDEVWTLSFSHDGTKLASGSKDRTAILWSVPPRGGLLTALHLLPGHTAAVAFLAWSPDDKRIITGCDDGVRVWDVATGQLLHSTSHHQGGAITAAAWLPDGSSFLTGGVDRCVVLADAATGREIQRWKRPYRVQDLALTRDGGLLILASCDRRVHLMRLQDGKDVALPPCPAPVTSLALSPDGRHLLVTLQCAEGAVWELGAVTAAAGYTPGLDVDPDPLDLLPAAPTASYRLPSDPSGRFVLRCGFGGSDNTLVLRGADDAQIYIWHRDSGELLLKLGGHGGTVNATAWNPVNPYMAASASDDKTVRVWLAPAARGGGGGGGVGIGGAAAEARRRALPLLVPAGGGAGGGIGGGVSPRGFLGGWPVGTLAPAGVEAAEGMVR